MGNHIGIGEHVECSVDRLSGTQQMAVAIDRKLYNMLMRGQSVEDLHFENHFVVECWREGELRWTERIKNNVTDEGKKVMLDAMFNSGTQYTTWYMSLIDGSGSTPAPADADTMSSHAGWSEYTAAYTEATRPEWTVGAASGTGTVQVTNASTVDFTADTAGPYTVWGIFVTSDNTKGGTSGKLWTAVGFSSSQSIDAPDVLKVTYTVTLSG